MMVGEVSETLEAKHIVTLEDFKTTTLPLESTFKLETPEFKMRVLSHEQRRAANADLYVARSCCGYAVDMRWAQLLTQIMALLLALIFLMAKMWTSEGCEEQQTWTGLFTFIVGLMVPTPLNRQYVTPVNGRRTP